MSNLQIADRIYTSRLFLGTGKFGSMSQMTEAVKLQDQGGNNGTKTHRPSVGFR